MPSNDSVIYFLFDVFSNSNYEIPNKMEGLSGLDSLETPGKPLGILGTCEWLSALMVLENKRIFMMLCRTERDVYDLIA